MIRVCELLLHMQVMHNIIIIVIEIRHYQTKKSFVVTLNKLKDSYYVTTM